MSRFFPFFTNLKSLFTAQYSRICVWIKCRRKKGSEKSIPTRNMLCFRLFCCTWTACEKKYAQTHQTPYFTCFHVLWKLDAEIAVRSVLVFSSCGKFFRNLVHWCIYRDEIRASLRSPSNEWIFNKLFNTSPMFIGLLWESILIWRSFEQM